MTPRSPYACSKLYAYWIVKNYRDAYNLHASNAIMFNYESPRRHPSFVTRKITTGVVKTLQDPQYKISLGNIYSLRDWSACWDTVEAMWLMMQQETPSDLVISSNEAHSIKEFIEIAFQVVGINIKWISGGLEEKGIDAETQMELVIIDPNYFRPLEVEHLHGDSTKARTLLNWQPKTTFSELVKIMMELLDIWAYRAHLSIPTTPKHRALQRFYLSRLDPLIQLLSKSLSLFEYCTQPRE
jgi:GDPmannose 4,6-dehydratase